MAKVYIGTSGWVYGHWKDVFYPRDLPSKDYLKYFSQHFKTAEVNYSFYHLPKTSTYEKWYSETPKNFIFSVKSSRFITHIKRLKGVKTAWKTFLNNASCLKEKLGPILFQFPPNFRADEENIKRLEKFLKMIKNKSLRFAFEFRHKSWRDEKIYNLLKKYNTAWVGGIVTADFVYIRMHGPESLYTSKYTKKELKDLAEKIKKWKKQGLDIFVYFNNDAYGYAIKNAQELIKML
jgi:uncharacterized protein YecE (DUF72 family)